MNHCGKLLAYEVIIVKNQTAKIYRITRANISRVTNRGVMMHCKEVTVTLLTLVGFVVENITYISKTKSSIEASHSIRQTLIAIASNNPVKYPSLSIF